MPKKCLWHCVAVRSHKRTPFVVVHQQRNDTMRYYWTEQFIQYTKLMNYFRFCCRIFLNFGWNRMLTIEWSNEHDNNELLIKTKFNFNLFTVVSITQSHTHIKRCISFVSKSNRMTQNVFPFAGPFARMSIPLNDTTIGRSSDKWMCNVAVQSGVWIVNDATSHTILCDQKE